MSGPKGYDYRTRTNGEVHIFSQGKLAKMLKDEEAQAFLKAVVEGDPQEAMADAVGWDTRSTRVADGRTGPGTNLHGNGASHAPQQFRRKTG